MSQLTLSSPAFRDGEPIPEQYGYGEQNVNPPLRVSGIPPSAETLALIMDDPDARAPAGKIWDHWVVWNIPVSQTEIPQGWDAGIAVEGRNDFGDPGYGGPNPPDGEHTYRFILYALDSNLNLSPGASADELREVLAGHIIEETALQGTYAP